MVLPAVVKVFYSEAKCTLLTSRFPLTFRNSRRTRSVETSSVTCTRHLAPNPNKTKVFSARCRNRTNRAIARVASVVHLCGLSHPPAAPGTISGFSDVWQVLWWVVIQKSCTTFGSGDQNFHRKPIGFLPPKPANGVTPGHSAWSWPFYTFKRRPLQIILMLTNVFRPKRQNIYLLSNLILPDTSSRWSMS